ncbi:membrane integrity-associated transporter subunit PqiC [Variovorax sp. KK3]|uniref:PqiC family protein n=1 Tax=Variovorax sp. KK3 TaxID=1855728 RepID=UPI00097CA77A|nr:PqiC family protein [Variovorax sp. KK3]
MSKHPSRGFAIGAVAAIAALLALAGCAANNPPQYYSLAESDSSPRAMASGANGFIELAPLAMPERLARPQMVVREKGADAGAQVRILDQHRWASSFESELRDALSSAIAQRLGAVDATRSARPRIQPGLRIAVQVQQFDAVEGSRVDAGFGWTLRRTEEGAPIGCQLFVSEPAPGGIESLALGTRRATARLADAIARSAKAQQANAADPCAA